VSQPLRNEASVQAGGARFEVPHRYKVYAAETGVSYRYFFIGRRGLVRPEGQGPGSDFSFVIAADQRPPFVVRIFVAERALTAWRLSHGRELDPNERYAAAKMRLFRAFDQSANLSQEPLSLVVDEENIEDLLDPLDLG
jgi:hypothetical protein